MVEVAFADGIVVVSVGLMLGLTLLMAGAAILLSVPDAFMHWVRRQRNSDRTA